MTNTFLRVIFIVACLCVSRVTTATIVTEQYLVWLQIGPQGELLISGTMGSMLSVDGGQTWTPPVPATEGGTIMQMLAGSVRQLSNQYSLTWPTPLGPWASVPAMDKQGRTYACSKDRVGVEYSDNHGKDWTMTVLLKDNGSGDCRNVRIIANKPYVLTQKAIVWSEDRGQEWIRTSELLEPFIGQGLLKLFGDDKGVLYVNHEGDRTKSDRTTKIFRSRDQGVSWEKRLFDLPEERAQGDILLLRIHQNTLYFVTRSKAANTPVTLYRSTDARTATKLLDIPLHGLEHAGFDFFAIGPHGELVVLGKQSVFISNDKGKTWKTIDRNALWKGPWFTHT